MIIIIIVLILIIINIHIYIYMFFWSHQKRMHTPRPSNKCNLFITFGWISALSNKGCPPLLSAGQRLVTWSTLIPEIRWCTWPVEFIAWESQSCEYFSLNQKPIIFLQRAKLLGFLLHAELRSKNPELWQLGRPWRPPSQTSMALLGSNRRMPYPLDPLGPIDGNRHLLVWGKTLEKNAGHQPTWSSFHLQLSFGCAV